MMQQQEIEQQYCSQVSLAHRKQFAQFFTPQPIAELMADWLLGNAQMKTVLEPAFGLGVFSRTLLKKKQTITIKGFDVDNQIFSYAQKVFMSQEQVHLLLDDYMYNDWANRYDGIICNPPYLKFHDYDNKSVLKEVQSKLNLKLTGFTNLYTLFLLKSLYQLADGGRCAYIVPSEFMNSDYGKLVKKHLLETETLRHVIVFNFRENVFDDAITTACIILCAKDEHKGFVQFSTIQSMEDLSQLCWNIGKYPQKPDFGQICSVTSLDPNIKWKAYYQQQNRDKYKNLVPFSNYAKVVRGIATGCNDFFTFSKEKAKEHEISEKYLLPCICHSVDFKGNLFTAKDFEQLVEQNKKVFLLNAQDANGDKIRKYLQYGESKKYHIRHLTANRNPWYALERRQPAPIWVSVFNRSGLRFVRNEANILNLTTFHCIYLQQGLFNDISADLFFTYLLTDFAKEIFADNAREYGNGLQKFEPNDLNTAMMIDLANMPISTQTTIENLYHQNAPNNSWDFLKDVNDMLRKEL